MIKICGPKDKPSPQDNFIINVTSGSTGWARMLSPLILGPVRLYGDKSAMRMENGWQFAKVYSEYIDPDGWPTNAYFRWAKKGWEDRWAHRYPMGKGAIPEYTYWNHERLGYIDARKQVYIPLYSQAVVGSEQLRQLKSIIKRFSSDVYLFDYDGYDHDKLGMTLDDVLNCKERKMGHAFVLKMLLS